MGSYPSLDPPRAASAAGSASCCGRSLAAKCATLACTCAWLDWGSATWPPAVDQVLTLQQRQIFVGIVNGVPLDALVAELGTAETPPTRCFRPRRKLRAEFVTNSYLDTGMKTSYEGLDRPCPVLATGPTTWDTKGPWSCRTSPSTWWPPTSPPSGQHCLEKHQ
jgi:hypothetical protein